MLTKEFVREVVRAAPARDRRVAKVALAMATSSRCRWERRIEARRRHLDADDTEADDVVVGDHSTRGSTRAWQAKFLYALTRHLRPASVVEMGTAVGISGSYIAGALADVGRGRLITLEGRPALADVARATFSELGLDGVVEVRTGWFDDTLEGALSDAAPVGLVFVDGNHHADPTLQYFELILPHLADNAVLVFDDIAWSDEMTETWATIRSDPRTMFSMGLGSIGVWGGRSLRE